MKTKIKQYNLRPGKEVIQEITETFNDKYEGILSFKIVGRTKISTTVLEWDGKKKN